MLNAEEIQLLSALKKRLQMLAQAADDHSVKLLVDAEHTFYQPAISHCAHELLQQHNQKGAVIINTYQVRSVFVQAETLEAHVLSQLVARFPCLMPNEYCLSAPTHIL